MKQDKPGAALLLGLGLCAFGAGEWFSARSVVGQLMAVVLLGAGLVFIVISVRMRS